MSAEEEPCVPFFFFDEVPAWLDAMGGVPADPIPYLHTDRSATVQETRIFSNSRIDVRQAIFVITKLLYSLGQNQHLSSVESTDAFFNITKLFQNPDVCHGFHAMFLCAEDRHVNCVAMDGWCWV